MFRLEVCTMITQRLYVLLLMLIITEWCVAQHGPHHGRRRRRPLDFQSSVTTHPMSDQIALANSWQSSNRVISASYEGNPDTGHINHANLVVNLLPSKKRPPMPSLKELAIAESLANTRTAAEYVKEAIRMRGNREVKAPHSSYVKYDVYEKQTTKSFLPLDPTSSSESEEEDDIDESNQIDSPEIPTTKFIGSNVHERSPPPAATTRSSKHYTEYEYNHRKPDYGHSEEHENAGELYTSYGTAYKNHYEPEVQDGYSEPSEESHSKPSEKLPKHEIIKHIQHSVMKYMKELEAEGKFAPSTTRPSPVEIKTYYRFPSSTPSPSSINYEMEGLHKPIGKGLSTYPKVYLSTSDGPSEYFKDPPHATPTPSSFNHAFTTLASHDLYPSTTMTPPSYQSDESESPTPHIDLTFRSKARPKPIDLAALDVGQSWSHDSEHQSDHQHSTRHKHRTKKPRQLHLNSQTYHEINSMGLPSTKSHYNYGELPAKDFSHDPSHKDIHHVTPVRFKNDMHSSAHHSIASPPEGFTEDAINEVQQHYRSPIHVINGVPVSNPFRFNMNQLNEMFGGVKEHRANDESESDDPVDTHHKESAWTPSFSPIPSFTKPRHPDHHHAKEKPTKTSTTYHHNLPYDSYNPKYNNNPDGEGYQDEYRHGDWEASETGHNYRGTSSDMYTSSSSKRAKKVKNPVAHSASNSTKKKSAVKRPDSFKGKSRPKPQKKSRSLETELRPPPQGAGQ